MLQTTKTHTKMKMIPCSHCGEDMPLLRLTKFGYDFCVNCSEQHNLVGKKRALPVQMGEGDHSWTETIIMEENDYLKHQELEQLISKENKKIISGDDIDEKNLQGPFRIINNSQTDL